MKIDLKSKFSLKEDQADSVEIRERIASGSKVTGTNMFILIFAILIACIGLNMDSTAVVIGAMLISPLMGILISMAYGIANHDIPWIKKSFSAFFLQIGISIITSTLYFKLSPINTFSGELAARTHPSFLDVLIAVLGGSAAIVANTRKNLISNVIPGTAIATALMPPLCTVGYCIATHKWYAALGSAYLFTINTIFICLSAFVGLHLMHVTSQKKLLRSLKSQIILILLLLIAVIPSCFLAWETVHESNIRKNFHTFVKNEFLFENTQVVTSAIDMQEKTIDISLIGTVITEPFLQSIEKKLPRYELEDYALNVIQTNIAKGISKEELNVILNNKDPDRLETRISDELEETRLLLEIRQEEDEETRNLTKELQILFPVVTSCGFSDMSVEKKEEPVYTLILVLSEDIENEDLKHIKEWAEQKLDKKIEILPIFP